MENTSVLLSGMFPTFFEEAKEAIKYLNQDIRSLGLDLN
jgi:hypothetical protein